MGYLTRAGDNSVGYHRYPTQKAPYQNKARWLTLKEFPVINTLFFLRKGNKMRTKLKAKQMAECDAELAAVLFSRQDKIAKDDQPVREADAIRKRSVCL